MLKRLLYIQRYLKHLTNSERHYDAGSEQKAPRALEPIPTSINDIENRLRTEFDRCEDIVLRKFKIGGDSSYHTLVVYFDGLVDKEILTSTVINPLMIQAREIIRDIPLNRRSAYEIIKESLLSNCEVESSKDYRFVIERMLTGDSILFVEGLDEAFVTCSRGWEARGVEEPDTEATVRGSREGFTECIRNNTAMIRRRIRNPKLKMEPFILGRQTNTKIIISYIEGIAHQEVVEEVRARIKRIDNDAILESGQLEELINDAPLSLFPTVGNSEKPDKVAAKMLEGRVAILCDGTPFVLTVPYLFVEAFQASEDYYSSSYSSSMIRVFRFIAFLFSIFLPAGYVALITFHRDVIPFELLVTVAAAREGLPFSSFTEAFIMGLIFELLREAGVRMPRPIGQAVSIVGALVLGEATIRAGIAGAPMIIVTAMTAICSFIVPPLNGFMPIVRLTALVCANILGFMGIVIFGAFGVVHLCSLRTFGVPYLFPFAPLHGDDLKDSLVRVPIWAMLTRPALLRSEAKQNKFRIKLHHQKRDSQ